MQAPSSHNPCHLISLKHPPAIPPIPLWRHKAPGGRLQQAFIVADRADLAAGGTYADGDLTVAVFRVVVADADLAHGAAQAFGDTGGRLCIAGGKDRQKFPTAGDASSDTG